ncbi:MAG: hypothetical protein IJ559_05340 [Prevotella sp.]|nr:hypothetical protein [Prevotella sp.]
MKKILLAAMAVLLMCACSGERQYLDYRGLSMGMSARQMADSLLAKMQNLAVDTHKTGETNIVLVDTLAQNFMVTVYHQNDTITDILENYVATYNDSTANLWQAMHDDLQKVFGWPNMGKHGDLHKEATFENEKGTVVLILLNTYSPTMSVRYSTSTTQD